MKSKRDAKLFREIRQEIVLFGIVNGEDESAEKDRMRETYEGCLMDMVKGGFV